MDLILELADDSYLGTHLDCPRSYDGEDVKSTRLPQRSLRNRLQELNGFISRAFFTYRFVCFGGLSEMLVVEKV